MSRSTRSRHPPPSLPSSSSIPEVLESGEDENESYQSTRSNSVRPLRASDLDSYFRPAMGTEMARDPRTGTPIRYCTVDECQWKNPTTTNCRRHLHIIHKIIPTPLESEIQIRTTQLLTTIGIDNEDCTKDEIETAIFHNWITNHSTAIKEALVRFIVVNSLPFDIVQMEELHGLLHLCNPEINIPQSHNTISSSVVAHWTDQKKIIRQDLCTAISPIHISLDIWTSPNTYLFLGIVAHFVRQNERQRSKVLLGLREIATHDGPEQWEVLRPVIEEFQFVQNFGSLMGDNSGTNGTLCRSIEEWYDDEEYGKWSAKDHQVRCIGHILNLIVQAFFSKDLSDYKAWDEAERAANEGADSIDETVINASADPQNVYDQNNSVNRKKFRTEMDLLGKLHNIVVHIRSSGGHMKKWLEHALRRIPLDNRTRWNSWFTMLDVALKLKRHVDWWTSIYKELKDDALTEIEWQLLQTTCTMLQYFHTVTLQLEGDQKGLSIVLLTLQVIEIKVKQSQLEFERIPGVSTRQKTMYKNRIKVCLEAVTKWWKILWNHPLYLMASVLNPRFRTRIITSYFEKAGSLYRETDCAEKLDTTKLIWLDWLRKKQELGKTYDQQHQRHRRRTEYQVEEAKARQNSILALGIELMPSLQITTTDDQYEQYIAEALIPCENPLAWWTDSAQRTTWPDLSRFAIEVLSIPAMSDEPERVFSGARRTVDWQRGSMIPETIEATECTKYFWVNQRKH